MDTIYCCQLGMRAACVSRAGKCVHVHPCACACTSASVQCVDACGVLLRACVRAGGRLHAHACARACVSERARAPVILHSPLLPEPAPGPPAPRSRLQSQPAAQALGTPVRRQERRPRARPKQGPRNGPNDARPFDKDGRNGRPSFRAILPGSLSSLPPSRALSLSLALPPSP